jgi:hypothetical protein
MGATYREWEGRCSWIGLWYNLTLFSVLNPGSSKSDAVIVLMTLAKVIEVKVAWDIDYIFHRSDQYSC